MEQLDSRYDFDRFLPKARRSTERLDDFKMYAADYREHKVDEREQQISEALRVFIAKNAGRDRYKTIREVDLRCEKNRLAMLTPPSSGFGYLTENDEKMWLYMTDLRNDLIRYMPADEVKFANTLLVNYQKKYRYTIQMCRNDDYLIDENHYDNTACEIYADTLDFLISLNFVKATPDDINLKNKKNTAWGYPNERVNGQTVTRDQLLWYPDLKVDGHEISSRAQSRAEVYHATRYVMDASWLKQEWRHDPRGCDRIFKEQCDCVDAGIRATPENIGYLVEHNLITIASDLLRENCPDSSDFQGSYSKGADMFSKNRRFTILHPDGTQIDGMIDSQKFNQIAREDISPWGYTNRARIAKSCNNAAQTYGSVLAKGSFHFSEGGSKGHPSTRAAVVNDHRLFYKVMKGRGLEVTLTTGDCTNAEVTFTTNKHIMRKLIPERFRNYYEFTNQAVCKVDGAFRFFDFSYMSGSWATTWGHITKGNFEKARLDYEAFKQAHYSHLRPFARYIMAYTLLLHLAGTKYECLIKELLVAGEDYDPETLSATVACGGSELGFVNPRLATDDMVGQVAWRGPTPLFDKVTQMAVEDQMGYERTDATTCFGMFITPNDMKESLTSRIPKIHKQERMGFSLKDGFGSFVRLKTCGYEDIVSRNLVKHFGSQCSVSDYGRYIIEFKRWLVNRGVNVEDVFSEFSPVETIMRGELIDPDKALHTLDELTNHSSRVPDEDVNRMKDNLIHYFWSDKHHGFSFKNQRFTDVFKNI